MCVYDWSSMANNNVSFTWSISKEIPPLHFLWILVHTWLFLVINYLYVFVIVLGSEYCGRRFATAEELLVHLKTHTSLSTSDPRALLSASSSNNTTSSGARFHPYARLSPNVPHAPTTTPLPPPPSLSLAAFASSPYASLYSSLFTRPPLLWRRGTASPIKPPHYQEIHSYFKDFKNKKI